MSGASAAGTTVKTCGLMQQCGFGGAGAVTWLVVQETYSQARNAERGAVTGSDRAHLPACRPCSAFRAPRSAFDAPVVGGLP